MQFSVEDKQAIKLLRQTKRYGAKRLQSMFPSRQWSLGGLNKLLRKIDDTGKVDRRSAPGTGRPIKSKKSISRFEPGTGLKMGGGLSHTK